MTDVGCPAVEHVYESLVHGPLDVQLLSTCMSLWFMDLVFQTQVLRRVFPSSAVLELRSKIDPNCLPAGMPLSV